MDGMNCVGHPQIRARPPLKGQRGPRLSALPGHCHAAERLGWPDLLTCKERPKYGFVCVRNLLILTSGQLVPFQRKNQCVGQMYYKRGLGSASASRNNLWYHKTWSAIMKGREREQFYKVREGLLQQKKNGKRITIQLANKWRWRTSQCRWYPN